MKEYREYGITVDKVNELGNAYDALLRGERPESPTRRRSSVTPNKRPSISSPLKSGGEFPRIFLSLIISLFIPTPIVSLA